MQRFLGFMFVSMVMLGLGCSSPTENQTETSSQQGSAPASTTPTAQPAAQTSQTSAGSPEEIAERVMQAASTADEEAFMALLTAKARESMASDDSGSFGGKEYDSFEIGEAVIDGSEASVPVEGVSAGETEKLDLKMRQEDGAWRLYAMGMEVAPGSKMTINFENIGQMMQEMVEGLGEAMGEAFSSAMENAFQSGSPEEIALNLAMFDGLEAVSVEDYEASWKSGESYQGTSRLDALNALAQPLALSVHAGDSADSLGDPVKTDTKGMSRLEAIERIANEAGLFSVLPDLQDWGIATAFMEGMAEAIGSIFEGDNPVVSVEGEDAQAAVDEALQAATDIPQNAITFVTDAPSQPSQFIGPFRLDLVEIEENAPYATGNLILRVAAHGLPAPVLTALEQQDESFQVHAVENADGEPLIDMDVSYMGGGSVVGSAYHDMATRELTGLLQRVDRIARIAGAVEVVRPTAVEELDFDSLAPGASQSAGGVTVTADQVDSYTSFKVTGGEDAVGELAVHAQAYGTDGEPMMLHYSDYQSWQAGEGQVSLNVDEKPARVRLKLVTASETSSYPYEFSDVVLARAAEQPEALAELDFGDHDGPLKITFGEIIERDSSFSKVTVNIENVSNKEPESAFVDFVYLDGSGNELESFPHTINGAFSADGFEPLAKPGETVESEQTAFQMPEGTQSIGFRFNHVEFMDGSRWEPEE